MQREPTFYSGDVILLPAKSRVLVNRKTLEITDVDKECVVEAARQLEPGLRTDHFMDGEVIDCRPLLAGEYDSTAPLMTIALSGDFNSDIMVEAPKKIKKMKKTYLLVTDHVEG
jgi:hypothetical protein